MSENGRIPPEILKKVRRIELSTRNLVEDLIGGEYQSVFKGSGMEFDEVREYAPGDEVRSIDWNVTARMGRPFVKRFREERELTVLLAVDASASGLFGSAERLKSEVIAEVASVLAFSAVRNQDKVGCLIFTDQVEKYIPPASGRRHVLRIIRELLYFKPEGEGTDIGRALETISRLLRRKAVVFLVSDFLDEDFETPLKLAARHHDLIALSIHDPLEERLPDVGLLHVRDAETGEDHWIDTRSDSVRGGFGTEAIGRRLDLEKLLARNAVDQISLDVSEDYVLPLTRFFRRRLRRIARGFRRVAPLLLLGIALAAANANAQQPMSPGIQARPPTAAGQAPAAGNGQAPGQSAQPQIPVIPRAEIDKLEQPTAADLTAAARPRRLREKDGPLRVESYLARDLQTIGDPNELIWSLLLPDGPEGIEPAWDFTGAPGLLPRVDPDDLSEELRARLAAIAPDSLAISDFISREEAGDTLRFRLPFTVMRPDTLDIPGQLFLYRVSGEDSLRRFVTSPLRLACMSVLAATADSAALRDWKAPGELRGDWLGPLLRWGIPLLLLLSAAGAFLRWWLRRSRPEIEAPPIPADEEALAALRELERRKLPMEGAFHAFYLSLSLILRRYLGRLANRPFAEWTTEEIEDEIPGVLTDPSLRDELIELLRKGDLVKFAKRRPTATECDRSLEFARGFVIATRPKDEDLEGAA